MKRRPRPWSRPKPTSFATVSDRTAQFEAILAFVDGEPAGLALFHSRFSTWLGRPGMYLEDLYVTEEARGLGVGRRLMARLAAIAVERGWGRIDFQVLDWNPARDFYHRLGMEHLGEWLRYGADGEALRRLAAEDARDSEPVSRHCVERGDEAIPVREVANRDEIASLRSQ